MARLVDTMFGGADRVIGAWEVRPGVVVDPGPASTVEALLAGLETEPAALLLTHIHLDHAGASGILARRFPELRVFVHEVGAPHVIDPSRLLASAGRLYGEENMDRLWGETVEVPEERVTILSGGEEVEGLDVHYAPGHAWHHVVYHDPASGDLFAGDAAGVRVPPDSLVFAPTPPPEIDVEEWLETIARLRALGPARLCMTHFGAGTDAPAQLDALEAWLHEAAERSEPRDEEAFLSWLEGRLSGGDVGFRQRQAAQPHQLWLGLERYWRKRAEREEQADAD